MVLNNSCIQFTMVDVLILVVVSTTLFIPIVVYFYFKHKYSFWSKQGISGPKPIPFLGTLYCYKGTVHEDEYEISKYGRLIGCYDVVTPVLMVTDPEVIKEVTVKRFSSFNANHLFFGDKILKQMLVQKSGEEWKKMRSHTTPMFTASKIKTMLPTIEESGKVLITHIDKYVESQGGENVPIKLRGYMGLFSIDIISKVAFSTDIQAFEKGESDEAIKKFTGLSQPSTVKYILSMFMPRKLRELMEFSVFPRDCIEYTLSFLRTVVEQKKQEGNKVAKKENEKFLDLFIKADVFTDEEILANAVMIFGGGLETTRTSLVLCLYFLSFHQEIQEKLFQEIKDLYDKEKFDADNIMAAEYLGAVVNETLRYYPPITRVDRIATEDVTLNSGITIPKGGIVRFPIYSIHHQEEYFPDNMEFKPERFIPENRESVKDVFISFFTGQRNCLGMRFASLEIRWVIGHLVLKYKFTRPPNDKETYRKLPANGQFLCSDVVLYIERR